MQSVKTEFIDDLAKMIYDSWNDIDGWVPWVKGGNSFKQDEARFLASEIVQRVVDAGDKAFKPDESVDYTQCLQNRTDTNDYVCPICGMTQDSYIFDNCPNN